VQSWTFLFSFRFWVENRHTSTLLIKGHFNERCGLVTIGRLID
jgi:hypothetical protein